MFMARFESLSTLVGGMDDRLLGLDITVQSMETHMQVMELRQMKCMICSERSILTWLILPGLSIHLFLLRDFLMAV